MKGYFDFGVKCTHAFSSPEPSLIEHEKVLLEGKKHLGSLHLRALGIFNFNPNNLLKNFIKKVEIKKISTFVHLYLFIRLSNYCYGKHIKFIGDE